MPIITDPFRYPTLDRPRTERETLEYLESSIVLAMTMAPEGAIPVLMKNAEVARYCLNDGKEPKPILAYFLDRGGSLINFGYPGGEF